MKTGQKTSGANQTVGYDYMDMVPHDSQTVQLGESVDLSCTSEEKISKCYFFTPSKLIRYELKNGFEFQNRRMQCLCDVSLLFLPNQE